MQIRVVPTRMELLRVKRRLELARRGHKLLQDRLEGLIKEFMPLVGEYVELRTRLDAGTPEMLGRFAHLASEAGEGPLRTALLQTGFASEVDAAVVKQAEVPVPRLTAKVARTSPFYSLLATPMGFDPAVGSLLDLFSLLLATAEKEEAVRRFAAEIERTRRRVNALEYILIPRLLAVRKTIQAKLDEDERASRVRNLKVKELLEKEAAGS